MKGERRGVGGKGGGGEIFANRQILQDLHGLRSGLAPPKHCCRQFRWEVSQLVLHKRHKGRDNQGGAAKQKSWQLIAEALARTYRDHIIDLEFVMYGEHRSYLRFSSIYLAMMRMLTEVKDRSQYKGLRCEVQSIIFKSIHFVQALNSLQ